MHWPFNLSCPGKQPALRWAHIFPRSPKLAATSRSCTWTASLRTRSVRYVTPEEEFFSQLLMLKLTTTSSAACGEQVATVTAFMCIRNFPSACFTSHCATLCREYSLIRKSKSLYKSDSDSWDIQNIQWYKIWLCVLNLTFLASWPAVTRDSSPLRCGSQTHHSSCEVYCSESQWCVCDEKQHFYHFSDTLLFLLPDENTHGHTRSPSHVKEDPPVMIWFFTVQD